MQSTRHDHAGAVEDHLRSEQSQERRPQRDLVCSQPLIGDTEGKETHDRVPQQRKNDRHADQTDQRNRRQGVRGVPALFLLTLDEVLDEGGNEDRGQHARRDQLEEDVGRGVGGLVGIGQERRTHGRCDHDHAHEPRDT
jgi:hypothetical protein